jgi:hypothetical protein
MLPAGMQHKDNTAAMSSVSSAVYPAIFDFRLLIVD